MNIALDIDGTITKTPEFFSLLARSVRNSGGKIIVVTSRMNTPEARDATDGELKEYGVEHDELFILPNAGQLQIECPHDELDDYSQYLWQKISICIDHEIDIVFEDDPLVIELFKTYAPHIHVFCA